MEILIFIPKAHPMGQPSELSSPGWSFRDSGMDTETRCEAALVHTKCSEWLRGMATKDSKDAVGGRSGLCDDFIETTSTASELKTIYETLVLPDASTIVFDSYIYSHDV